MNYKKEVIMQVRVLHSVALRQSAVQLYVGKRLKIISHIVGLDTIGFEEIHKCSDTAMQIGSTDSNWRAMLIKDHLGDWAICVGEWYGMKRGARNGRLSVRGNPGYFKAYIHRKGTKGFQSLDLNPNADRYVAKMGQPLDFRWDFMNGEILLNADVEDPLHEVALAFTISTLYLLVQPRPETLPVPYREPVGTIQLVISNQ